MIIDTKGFEIGDEVWWWEIDYLDGNKYTYRSNIIYSILYTRHGIFLIMDDKYDTRVHINMCFNSEQEIETMCDKLNCKI